jgi:hypothetical protein
MEKGFCKSTGQQAKGDEGDGGVDGRSKRV